MKEVTKKDVLRFKAYLDMAPKPLNNKDVQKLFDIIGIECNIPITFVQSYNGFKWYILHKISDAVEETYSDKRPTDNSWTYNRVFLIDLYFYVSRTLPPNLSNENDN